MSTASSVTSSAVTNPDNARTLPALLLHRAKTTPTEPALRLHRLGLWEPTPWSELSEQVQLIGNGLAAHGVERGDVVALLSRNTPEWIAVDLAIQGLAAVTFAIDPDLSPTTVQRLLTEHAVRTVFVGDQEQFDKVDAARAAGAKVNDVIVVATRGMRHLDADSGSTDATQGGVTTLDKLCVAGSTAPNVWVARAESLAPDDVVTMTAFAERNEDGARLITSASTSADVIRAAEELQQRLGAHAHDELLPGASFADPIERGVSEFLALRIGAVINLGEGGALAALEARQVQPTIAHVPASRLAEIRADIERRRPRRGLRRRAIDSLLATDERTTAPSRSSRRDLLVTYGGLIGVAVLAAVIHRTLVHQSGVLRLAIIAAVCALTAALLIGKGFAIRPFIRKAYGLAGAHTLLTGPDIDSSTRALLQRLEINPIVSDAATAALTPTADPAANKHAASTEAPR